MKTKFLLETNSMNKVTSDNLKATSRRELISFSRKRSNNLVILFIRYYMGQWRLYSPKFKKHSKIHWNETSNSNEKSELTRQVSLAEKVFYYFHNKRTSSLFSQSSVHLQGHPDSNPRGPFAARIHSKAASGIQLYLITCQKLKYCD